MKRLNVAFGGLILAALLSTSALADTVYTYTGSTFTMGKTNSTPDPPFTTSDSVSGWFSVAAPLAANMSFGSVSLIAYSFSSGIDTITHVDPSSYFDFRVATDSTGAIDLWIIDLEGLITDPTFSAVGSYNNSSVYYLVDDFGIRGGGVVGWNRNDPGTWTSSTTDPSPATPEPSSLILLGTGALGLAGTVRRKLQG
jgi:PEP-CTERM motif